MELPKRKTSQVIGVTCILAVVSVFLFHSCSSTESGLPHWLKGEWKTSLNGITIKEKWIQQGDSLVGVISWANDQNKRVDHSVICFQHDTLVFKLITGKKEPIYFRCTDASKDTLAFVNKHNDFPKRIVYVRPTGKTMRTWVDNGAGDPNRINYPFEKISSH
ncbi:MAG: hypothetical protein A3D31_05835 [Candidatus Fluviicola riflensis]|nr:MAG: hypothetical protein CHH17_09180 [Candidatus Fluviicola riflensis]OGS79489.1 MAG: hypothetical protein A3D31_05835 [Candidatus Fluviicola riflensis]